MKKSLKIILIIVAIFFVIGMIVGNYHCADHFCNTVSGLVNFVTDVCKTEVKGITWTVSSIGKLFS